MAKSKTFKIVTRYALKNAMYCLNPMRRQFGDRKISRKTEGPEGDFVGPQTLFAWDLHS